MHLALILTSLQRSYQTIDFIANYFSYAIANKKALR